MTQLFTIQPESVLDVGCSFGYTLQRLAELLPDTRLAGVDCEQDKLDLAVEFGHATFETYKAFAHELPFEDDEFEWVYCSHTLEHCHDVSAVVDELYRVARALVFVVVPLEGDEKYERLRQKELDVGNPGSHLHQFNTKDPYVWMDLLKREGALPVFYNFTNRSDIVMAMLKTANVKMSYGGFRGEGYEDRTGH